MLSETEYCRSRGDAADKPGRYRAGRTARDCAFDDEGRICASETDPVAMSHSNSPASKLRPE
ncbi:hypothetical protein KCP78_17715 [Salmonella enterica subsp. enterica]|nr:hypothetical protein KCP78_17715 [Salmonella enterica subsp. enterica]